MRVTKIKRTKKSGKSANDKGENHMMGFDLGDGTQLLPKKGMKRNPILYYLNHADKGRWYMHDIFPSALISYIFYTYFMH